MCPTAASASITCRINTGNKRLRLIFGIRSSILIIAFSYSIIFLGEGNEEGERRAGEEEAL